MESVHEREFAKSYREVFVLCSGALASRAATAGALRADIIDISLSINATQCVCDPMPLCIGTLGQWRPDGLAVRSFVGSSKPQNQVCNVAYGIIPTRRLLLRRKLCKPLLQVPLDS